MEHMQVLPQEAEVQTTNFIASRSISSSPAYIQQQTVLYSPNNLQNGPTLTNPIFSKGSALSLTRANRYKLSQAQNFCRQTSVPMQRTQSTFSPLSYLPSNGSNSSNVTLTRENSRVPSRSSTFCGPLIAKTSKQNGNIDSFIPAKYSNVYNANATDPLLNEEVR